MKTSDCCFNRSPLLVLFSLLLLIGGCAAPPASNVHQPMSARPAQSVEPPVANGAIYQSRYQAQVGYRYRPLFEDRRARAVGDVLTININETTQASKASNTNASRSGANSMSIGGLSGLPGKTLLGASLDASSSHSLEGKGDSASKNAFSGTITVTVVEVLPNGNLLVSGEKQIGINQGSEFVRFSGVVNPTLLSAGNMVSSTLVADARLEYRANGVIDEAQVMGWLARFFLSFLPF